MIIFRFALISTTLLALSAKAQSSTKQQIKSPTDLPFALYLKKCSAEKSQCPNAVISLLESKTLLWGDTSKDYEEGFLSLKQNRPEIVFVKNAVGQLGVESRGSQGVKPVMRLNANDDAWDLLLTIAHEMHHFKTLMSRLPKISSSVLVANCTTAYRIDGLKDETPAYLSELKFWEDSPAWFKNAFKTKNRQWDLMDHQELSYAEYYKKLKSKIADDPMFIAKKYAQANLYPKCALKLLSK